MPKEKSDKETLAEWKRNPIYWKKGWLYFNPKDKRIFPPKRNNGAGWAVNFANPYSIVAFIIFMALIWYLFTFLTNALQK